MGVEQAALFALLLGCAAACGGSERTSGGHASSAGGAATDGSGGAAATSGPGGAGGSATGGSGGGGAGPPDYDVHADDRAGCAFEPGSHTTKTVGPNVPHGDALPFDHVVVLMFENRSFDHWFSALPSTGVVDVDVATEADTNPDPMPPLTAVHRYHEPRYCTADTNHEWDAVHLQFDGGYMDGFVATNNPGGGRAMGYYTDRDLPLSYWLAGQYAIGDRYFSSILGPTWPNRFYFWGATSWGGTNTGGVLPPFDQVKIVNEMDDAGRSWEIYHDGATSFGILFGPQYIGTDISAFESDAATGNLPNLSIIDPNFMGGGENDAHPSANVQESEVFLERIVNALTNSPSWRKSVLFVTFDEHGGFYDHVAPPPACAPDDNVVPDYAFDNLGVRVPVMVISPFTKPGYVSHIVADHTSITRFIENRFDLPAMTARDANAWPMLDYFDFEHPPLRTPPSGAPPAIVDPAGDAWCQSNPPGTGDVGASMDLLPSQTNCAGVDTELNDYEVYAVPLVDTDDCDSNSWYFDGYVGDSDADYFEFLGSDTSLCSVDPTASISDPSLRICMFIACADGATDLQSCPDGAFHWSPAGLPGCCSVGGPVSAQFNCPAADDSARVYLRVDGLNGQSCTPYTVDYHF